MPGNARISCPLIFGGYRCEAFWVAQDTRSLGSIDELPGSLGDAATATRLERTPAGLRGVIQGPLAVFQRRKNAIDPVKHLLLECALPIGGGAFAGGEAR